MFSKVRKYAAVVGVCVGSLAIAGAAMATTATFTPTGDVTGTAGASQLALRTARRSLNCTTSGATATLSNRSGTLPITVSTDLEALFGSNFGGGRCTVTGGAGITIDCSASLARLQVTGVTASGITPGTILGIRCSVRLNGSMTCSVNVTDAPGTGGGSVTGSYNNTGSRLTVNVGGQSLFTTGSTCATLPNDGDTSFTDASGNALVYSISPSTSLTVA